jgi:hypothetical protein
MVGCGMGKLIILRVGVRELPLCSSGRLWGGLHEESDFWVGGVAQVVREPHLLYLASTKTLSLNPRTTKTNKQSKLTNQTKQKNPSDS